MGPREGRARVCREGTGAGFLGLGRCPGEAAAVTGRGRVSSGRQGFGKGCGEGWE